MMENTDLFNFSSLLESEGDFHFGAKATSFLPPATASPAAENNASFDLPEWMESWEKLSQAEQFNDLFLPQTFQHEAPLLQEECSSSIKPEDMLVPLSELQPLPSLTPPPEPVHAPSTMVSTLATPVVPKIIICKKVTGPTLKPKAPQVIYHVKPVQQTVTHLKGIPSQEPIAMPQHPVMPTCDAEVLINEMVQMIGSGDANDSFVSLESLENTPFDSAMVEADMTDLLRQLQGDITDLQPPNAAVLTIEPPLTDVQAPDASVFTIEPPSPVSLPSPVPSAGSLSPAPSTSESFFASSPSPSPLSPSSSKVSAMDSSLTSDCSEDDWSSLEAHSYSRSTRKSKSSRRSASRLSPYSDDRRERKKEQNKQAALRYRQKKKQEEDDLSGKIKAEEERQEQLKAKYTNLKQELTYLKKIMREIFIARGVLSEEALKKHKNVK